MDDTFYPFKLGSFECASVIGGSHDYRLGSFFPNVPEERIKEALSQRGLPTGHVWTPYTCLHVDTGDHQVLIDMGVSTDTMLGSLRAGGLDPAAVDTVVITHAHPDHLGGTLDDNGQPVYAGASYYIMREEWDFWFSEQAASMAPEKHGAIARHNLEPIRDRMSLLEGESEIVPGIRAVPAFGHTPGHMVVSIASDGEELLYISDTALYPLHLEHPDWLPIYDILPEQAAASKRAIFDRAAEDRILVHGMHFPPFPGLGHVVRMGEGWQWQPIKATA